MYSRIYLTGFMGSGKTTHGKKIARMMAYAFVDLDQEIVSAEGASINDIFSRHGESYFRQVEKNILHELGSREKVVISTGGGTPCFHNNLEFMKESGLVVYIKLSPAALFSRLQQSADSRPLLAGKSPEEMKAYIEEKLAEREPFYNQANMTIDGLHQVDERLVNAIQRRKP